MDDDKKLYPCSHPGCTVMRTEAEGGAIFTVCDEHWKIKYPEKIKLYDLSSCDCDCDIVKGGDGIYVKYDDYKTIFDLCHDIAMRLSSGNAVIPHCDLDKRLREVL